MALTLQEYAATINKKAVKAMEQAVTMLEADTKLLTHVDTGALRRSWASEVEEGKEGVVGYVGSSISYAPYENWKHPNLSLAVDNDKVRITELFKEVFSNV